MNPVADAQCPYRTPGYRTEILDDEIILFNPESRAIFHSNSSGALIWALCDGRRTVADIIRLVSESYPEAADQIPGDVREALAIFAQHGAIQWG
jgi:hypothetical protein